MPDRIYFKQIEMGPMQNFVYLIGSTETRKVAVVDAAWGLIGFFASPLKMKWKLLTRL